MSLEILPVRNLVSARNCILRDVEVEPLLQLKLCKLEGREFQVHGERPNRCRLYSAQRAEAASAEETSKR